MRHRLLLCPTLLAALATAACGQGEDINLTHEIPCDEGSPCPTGFSCRIKKCVAYGSLPADAACTDSIQCVEGLVCRELTCQNGCTDLWYLDDCRDRTWCKPVPGETVATSEGRVPAGECAESECNPAVSATCTDGSACVAIGVDVGACLPYCEYGFDLAGYFDSCVDEGGIDYACQPMGLTAVPVCFPAGSSGAPLVGLPGCDAVWNPCQSGAICFNVVCRRLCSAAQLNPCSAGEVCASVGERADLAFCRAD